MPHDDPAINPTYVVSPVARTRRSGIGNRMAGLVLTPKAAKDFLSRTRDVVLPPQCLGCREIVETPDTLCGACWSTLHMIGPAVCNACGLPFPYQQDAPLCASCAGKSPPFQRARSAVIYNDASRDLVLAFKHADRTEAARLFAHWMATAAPELITDADVVVPVPLDRRRLFDRRYNQAALLAQELGQLSGVPVMLDGVERVKPSPPFGKHKNSKRMSRIERRRNVAGAFRCRDTAKAEFRNKHVLVVDDVYTTGATAWAMSRCLKRVGVAAVDILTVARVVHD